MTVIEYGVRDLRNRTPEVIAAIENSDTVYLTKRGRRIGKIVPRETPVSALLHKAVLLGTQDTGWADELATAKSADIEAQARRWE